jgi:hypothetical protein
MVRKKAAKKSTRAKKAKVEKLTPEEEAGISEIAMGDSMRKTGMQMDCGKSITEDFDFSMQDVDDCNMKSSRTGNHKIPKEVYIQKYNGSSIVN